VPSVVRMLAAPPELNSTQDTVAGRSFSILCVPAVGWGLRPPASQLHYTNICLALYISLKPCLMMLVLTAAGGGGGGLKHLPFQAPRYPCRVDSLGSSPDRSLSSLILQFFNCSARMEHVLHHRQVSLLSEPQFPYLWNGSVNC
jgi:hypothetical protein